MRVLKYIRFTGDYGLHYTILLYLKDTVMLIGYLMLKTRNPKVVICSHWEVHQSRGNPQNKRLLLDPRWNLSSKGNTYVYFTGFNRCYLSLVGLVSLGVNFIHVRICW